MIYVTRQTDWRQPHGQVFVMAMISELAIYYLLHMRYSPDKQHRELTAHDLAFGVGRKATKAELQELLSKPSGKGKNAKKVLSDLKMHLVDRRTKRKAS